MTEHSMTEHLNMGGLPIRFPAISPIKTASDFMGSKALLESIQFRNLQWDKPGHDPVFSLHAGQRVLAEMERRLKKKKEWQKSESIKLKAQWDHLTKLEQKLKWTFLSMNEFLRSNDEKRVRAVQTKAIEAEVVKKRSKDIDKLKDQMDRLMGMQKNLDENIAKLTIYEKYLHTVLDADVDFKHVDELVARYEALVATRNELGRRQDENLKDLELVKIKTAKMIEEYRFKILGLNNVVADLNSRYNVAFREAVHWEDTVLAIKAASFEKYKELTEVKLACRNMYLMMCKRKHEMPRIPEKDVERQLLYIKKTLQEVQLIKSIFKEEDKKKPIRKKK